jgi:predicted PurR-regulated permease PerM
MQFQYHADLTFGALRRWFLAQCYDALLVSILWLMALLWLHVPGAVFWAVVAGGLQWIPHFGLVLALFGPAMAMLFSGAPLDRWLGLLASYAAIAAIDGFLLQPYLMRRQNRVPIWASLLVPVLLGIVLPFWGVLFAPPLLAVIFAYRAAPKPEPAAKEQKFSVEDQGIVLPPEKQPGGDANGRR